MCLNYICRRISYTYICIYECTYFHKDTLSFRTSVPHVCEAADIDVNKYRHMPTYI